MRRSEKGNEESGSCPKCGSTNYLVLEGLQMFNSAGGCNQSVIVEISGQLKTFRMLVCAHCYNEPDFNSVPWYRERAACQCALCNFEWDWMDDSIRKCDRGTEL